MADTPSSTADEDETPWLQPARDYRLTVRVFLSALGFIYFVAFLALALQLRPLLGAHGLMPAVNFLERVQAHFGSRWSGFWNVPSLFWFANSDWLMLVAAWFGVALSLVVMLGFGSAPLLAVLWVLYLSFVHIGQIFYGYGWEALLCESGFLAIFIAQPLGIRRTHTAVPLPLIVLLRWLCFRVMFGAGLIKIRGDSCWSDLTCLIYHYETQPNPNPLSPLFHRLPAFVHRGGVVFNHFVELVAPWGVFGPRAVRCSAGIFIILFQIVLILSGNLSFLNWLTIVVAIPCLDDDFLRTLTPSPLRARIPKLPTPVEISKARRTTVIVLCVVIGMLSLNPIVNMLSTRQRMNASFDPFQLVNTYGAFGSIGRVRHEVILEGTTERTLSARTRWLEYEFPCKPGDPLRRPCWISPYHLRLDWQMWFAALGNYETQPWLVHLIYKLLQGDHQFDRLLAKNPFPDRPPQFIRARFYRYRFSRTAEPGYWHRELVAEYLPPLSLNHPGLREFLATYGWLDESVPP